VKPLARQIALRGIVSALRRCGLPAGRRSGHRRASAPPGVRTLAVVGFLETASGLGAAARGLCQALADLRPVPVSLSALARTALLPAEPRPVATVDPGSTVGHDVAIHLYNPDVFLAAVRIHGTRFLRANALNIAVVNWETDRLPPRWADVLSLYDGLCAPSSFTARTVERATGRPVTVVPNFVPDRPPRCRDRSDSTYEFLCMFDHHSDIERKHPAAAIRAFRAALRALPADTRCRLRIKCHADTPGAVIAGLRRECGADPIEIVAATLSAARMESLWRECDCLVSLHRSEGFGLPIAEAVARAIPVIATRQGGVLDFVDDDGCLFVPGPAALRNGRQSDYPEWSGWVEPDTAAAAAQMLRVVSAYDDAVARGQRGRRRLVTVTSAAVVQAAVEEAIARAHGADRPE